MKLNKQLLLVSLLLLSLPWAGCQYMRAVDLALQEFQENALIMTSKAVVDRVEAKFTLLNEHFISVQQDSFPLYLHSFSYSAIMDAYKDDWLSSIPHSEKIKSQDASLSLMASRYQNDVYLFIEVQDEELTYYNPTVTDLGGIDHIVLHLYPSFEQDKIKKIALFASAPGHLIARDMATGLPVSTINGFWRENEMGYQIELEINKTLLISGFDLEAIRNTSESDQSILLSESLSRTINNKKYKKIEIISKSLPYSLELETLSLIDESVYILNEQRYIIAHLEQENDRNISQETPWFVAWLYRKILSAKPLPVKSEVVNHQQWDLPNPEFIEKEGVKILWYRIFDGNLNNKLAVSVVTPMTIGEKIKGYLVLEKNTDRLIALTNSAFNQLLLSIFAVFLLVMIGLLFYASWLSYRVTRLNRIASDIVRDKDFVVLNEDQWPELSAKDELGDLSRSYRQLLLRVRESHVYLKGLSGKLSHELQTPIAIIRSSLENLGDVSQLSEEKKYLQRAQDGLERLNGIMSSMSSANRIEDSLQDVDFIITDVNDFLSSLAIMYQDAFPDYRFDYSANKESIILPLAQELVVQMVDKLIDNAVSYSPKDDPILIRLLSNNDQLQIEIENKGSLLPLDMQDRLFDSMVSLRKTTLEKDKPHLGLGLYIVRIIAELHGAEVLARNNNNKTGVIFTVVFPRV